MSKILVTGAAGQVGQCLKMTLPAHRLEARFFSRKELDITDNQAVQSCVRTVQPDVIINAAAYTAVDKAESEQDMAMQVNAGGPRNLAQAAASASAVLVYISTDYVFDGSKTEPWREADAVNPLNVYGASKAAGEEAVRAGIKRHLILRTAWVFSPYGNNFVKNILRLGEDQDELRVVSDQRGTPTGAMDIAVALAGMAVKVLSEDRPEIWGTYHYTCRGWTTWHGLAELVFDTAATRWRRRPKVRAISTFDYPTAARRPQNSVLNCTRFDRVFDLDRRIWQTSVSKTVVQLLADSKKP